MSPRRNVLAERRWAERIAPHKIRALYRSEARGLLDADLLLKVGWALWARARDVAEVSTAVLRGVLPCPECGGEAQRPRVAERPSRRPARRQVACEACGYVGDWYEVREALRRQPRCLGCATPLEWSYADWVMTCPSCHAAVTHRSYRARLKARKRLPCPQCQAQLTQPPRTAVAEPTVAAAKSAGRGTDIVACRACGCTRSWASVRRTWQGRRLLTGAGVPACRRLVAEWPGCRDVGAQMILVDAFLHELHTGPLAPLFIDARPGSVRRLLDEIGGIRRRP